MKDRSVKKVRQKLKALAGQFKNQFSVKFLADRTLFAVCSLFFIYSNFGPVARRLGSKPQFLIRLTGDMALFITIKAGIRIILEAFRISWILVLLC